MSKCVIKNLHLLNTLARAKPAVRKEMLKQCGFRVIKSIVECLENVLRGNVKMDTKHFKKLKRHKKHLERIYRSGRKWSSKKKVIIQSGGGFLPALLLPVISAIATQLL